jgi:hypothetical protein
MKGNGGRAVWAAAVSVAGMGAAWARAAEPTQQELVDQITALRAKVEQLEARQGPQAPATQSATAAPEGREATIDGVLRDADRRSTPSFLQVSGVTAGYVKNKFIIQDEAGMFVLNPNIQVQFRHVANFRSDNTADGSGEDTIESGFEVRRLKFAFEGSLFGPNLTYVFKWATDRTSGNPLLEDAWFRWSLGTAFGDWGKDFALRVGQFKDPTFHEEINSSKRQLAVDRSLLNEVLAGGVTDFVQGVTLVWDDGPEGRPLRAEVGFTDGINSDNTNFVDGGGGAIYGATNPDWGAFARVEYLAMGGWKQYDDFSAMDNTEDMLVLGFGATYTENGQTTGGGDTLIHTVDAQYEVGRLGLYGAYVGAYSEPPTAGEGGVYDWGFLAQAGYMLNKKWELFGRYDMTFLDDNRFSSADTEDTFPEATVGLNYYMKGHAAKLTIDGTWLPNGSPSNQTGIGILDPDNDEDQFMIRTQFQLLI